MLTYEEFKEFIYKVLREEFGGSASFILKTVPKLNGTSYEGLGIDLGIPEISPMLPIEKIYSLYQLRPLMLDKIIAHVQNMAANIPEEIRGLVRAMDEKENMENRIFMRVINYDKNRKWLEEVPHRKVLDLALTFYVGAGGKCSNDYIINLNNQMAESMGLTIEKLEELAYRNMSAVQKPVLKNVEEILSESLSDDFILSGCGEAGAMDEIFVLSNEADHLGAVCMFYEQVLENWAEKISDDFYILPSSLHEVLLVPRLGNEDWRSLRQMVRCINKTVVDEKEILSDEIYIYERGKGEIRLADNNLKE